MGLRSKMDHCVNLVVTEYFLNQNLITDVAFNECMPIFSWHVGQVIKAASIGSFVQVENTNILVFLKCMANEIRPNESSTTCYQNIIHLVPRHAALYISSVDYQ